MQTAARQLSDYDLALAHDGAAQAGPTAWLEVLDGELKSRGIVGGERDRLARLGYLIRTKLIAFYWIEEVNRAWQLAR